MKSLNQIVCFTLLVFLANCSSSGKQKDFLSEKEIYQYGIKYTEWFYSSELDSMIIKILDKGYKTSELIEFRKTVESQLGKRTEKLNEQYGIEPWQNYYIQYAFFEKVEQPVRTLFVFNNQGMILKFSVQILSKEAESHYSEYQAKTKLSFPFREQWFVAWGGRKINENQHAVSKAQRYAYDFVIRKGVKTFEGTGKSNDDYYCYEKEVIAPAAGKIVEIINHVAENKIGKMPPVHGNRVVIDHGNGEYSIIAHFKMGSIVVKKNSFVKQGQLLGLCGNSGQSSEPHIHYHLQNSPDIDHGEGLPVKFYSYLLNGKYIEVGEPKIGEQVKNY